MLRVQDHCQIKLVLGCKQEFLELALIYTNELGLNLPGNVEETKTLYLQLSKLKVFL